MFWFMFNVCFDLCSMYVLIYVKCMFWFMCNLCFVLCSMYILIYVECIYWFMCNVCIDVCFDVMCCLKHMDCHVVCLGTMSSSYFNFFFRLSMEEKINIGGTLCSSANLLTIPIIEATHNIKIYVVCCDVCFHVLIYV